MPVSIARKIAFDTLLRVESESAYASELLHAALGRDVKTADAALATEITLGVLRWQRLLDFLLDRQLKKSVVKLDLPVALALRMGLYQLRFLEKIPARAAVNESVELVKRARKSSAAALVNAVLRHTAGEAKSAVGELFPRDFPLAERLGILHSHPTWLVERWLARYGETAAVALLEANNRPPRLGFAVHDAEHRDEIIRGLESSGLRVEPGKLLDSAFAASRGSISETGAFRSGQISIQDEASQAIPLLLEVRSGDRVLDFCAAPGGKTAELARSAGRSGLVIAGELHEHRLRAMKARLAQISASPRGDQEPGALRLEKECAAADRKAARVDLIAFDATKPLPLAMKFDRVLVDAPCSGTGTLARHPEIRWRLRPEQLSEFHALQANLLRVALEHLAPGGRMVYSTCSMEPEENETVITEVLNLKTSTPIRILPTAESAKALAPHLASGVNVDLLFELDGFFRTLPSREGTDGFFAAVLKNPTEQL